MASVVGCSFRKRRSFLRNPEGPNSLRIIPGRHGDSAERPRRSRCLGAQRRSAEATAQSAQEEAGAFLGAQRRSAEGVLLPPPAYHYLPETWPHVMYQYWGYYGPVLAAHVGSFHSGKRKRQVISDACTNCRRSKLKCDEEKPCQCVKQTSVWTGPRYN